ncbi:hypothetical protein HanIR_Chr15g0738741 [Helianthus annuus]|nr:hypothetical protein HanIR_Chr15g0738741 [Helianthus annuus]
MVFVCNIALFSDFTLSASEWIVLSQNGNGSSKMLKEIILALCHFLHKWFSSLVICQLVVHNQQTLVVQYVSVVIVVEFHRGTTVISHVLNGLRVWDCVRALVEHVLNMTWVKNRVHRGI